MIAEIMVKEITAMAATMIIMMIIMKKITHHLVLSNLGLVEDFIAILEQDSVIRL